MDERQESDTRLQSLLQKEGQDLVRALIEEFGALNSGIAALKRELAALSDYQGMRDRLLVIEAAARKNRHLPRVVCVEADQGLRDQDGFYPLEHTPEGVPFRWTGPAPQFSFDLFVDRTHAVDLKLEALSCIDFEVQKNIALLADGESIPVHMEKKSDSLLDVTAILPPRKGSDGTNLTFLLPSTLVPPESQDPRALGIAFWRLYAAARDVGAGGPAAAE